MKGTDNQPQWDAKRLIQEYAKLAKLISHYKEKSFGDIAWSNQIRIKRIASVLSAFMGLRHMEENPLRFISSVFDGWHYDHILHKSPLSKEDCVKLKSLLYKATIDDKKIAFLINKFHIRKIDREQMLNNFIDFRIASEELLKQFGGVLEASEGGYLSIYAVQGLYFPNIIYCNSKVDDMIVLLLGDKFKKSFSEEELIADYGYPKETDDELFEWDCDNF